jgi:hypothetical protein
MDVSRFLAGPSAIVGLCNAGRRKLFEFEGDANVRTSCSGFWSAIDLPIGPSQVVPINFGEI